MTASDPNPIVEFRLVCYLGNRIKSNSGHLWRLFVESISNHATSRIEVRLGPFQRWSCTSATHSEKTLPALFLPVAAIFSAGGPGNVLIPKNSGFLTCMASVTPISDETGSQEVCFLAAESTAPAKIGQPTKCPLANTRSVRAALVAAFAISIVLADTAQARLLDWPQFGSWWGVHGSIRHSHRHRHPKPASSTTEQAAETPNGPLQIIISIADQRISVYDNDALIARSSVSTGVRGHPTPLGVFSVISKQRWHRSNLYSGAPMPYMQRITWSGIALHAGIVPGHPASHGCIRLKNAFAIRLWGFTKLGARVIIAPGDARPVEIAHPKLFVSETKVASRSLEAQAGVRNGGTMTVAAAAPSTSNADRQQVTDLETLDFTPATVAPRKVAPISVFVSRKSSRLFVRHGFTPLFDTSVKIQDPEQSLGTHVFTVIGTQNETEKLHWTVVSMPEVEKTSSPHARVKQVGENTPALSSPEKANAALGRIEIPPDAAERISELLTPGSSFILSDFSVSRETGKGTDFIVITK